MKLSPQPSAPNLSGAAYPPRQRLGNSPAGQSSHTPRRAFPELLTQEEIDMQDRGNYWALFYHAAVIGGTVLAAHVLFTAVAA